MLKLLLVVVFIVIFLSEFWFMKDINQDNQVALVNVKTEKLPILTDQNSSVEKFFDRELWILTRADEVATVETENLLIDEDTNETIKLINRKNSKQLCKGESCMTIKGILSNTLLLEKDGNITTLRPSEIIFDVIKFIGIADTKLSFEDNNSKERYELEFFSYTQFSDNNDTNSSNQKDKK